MVDDAPAPSSEQTPSPRASGAWDAAASRKLPELRSFLPLPLRVTNDGADVEAVDGREMPDSFDEAQSAAMVRALNCHDDLVAALRVFANCARDGGLREDLLSGLRPHERQTFSDALDAAASTLAKAES